MDIELYGRVLWRHKLVMAIGLLLAVTLAVLSYVRIGANGITYRDGQKWVSYQTLAVTQPGFMEGRLVPGGADPSRLTSLAVVYSKYLSADPVRHAIWPDGAHAETVDAAPVLAISGNSSAGALPIISIAGFSPSGAGSQQLAARASDALVRYITHRQDDAGIPRAQRVELQ